MNIAAVTTFYDSDLDQLEAWAGFYADYADLLTQHIIVDNDSRPDYMARVRERFPNSTVVSRTANGGTTGAFNSGIVCALENPSIDAVLLISADIRLPKISLLQMSGLLASAPDIGVVGGVVYCADTVNQIESYGGTVRKDGFILTYNYPNCLDLSVVPDVLEVDVIPGGINLAKREVYERVGLQDERLFMYCDEIDWDHRVRLAEYRLLVTKKAQAWHEHNTRPVANTRSRKLARFYDNRNHVYLVGKYYGRARASIYLLRSLLPYPRRVAGALLHDPRALWDTIIPQIAGGVYGLLGLMGRRSIFTR